jgi:hypothetical protein
MKKTIVFAALAAATLWTSAAQSAVVRVTEAAFIAGSGLITFSEKPLNTVNPIYIAADYGGGAGSPTVSFGGFFTGQALGTAGTCPAGAAVSGCVVGTPTGPLSLSSTAPSAFITDDGAFPSTPTLSGSPQFNGPIALLFDIDVAGVGLEVGFLDAIGGTGISAFDRAGNVLGTVTSTQTGIEFLGLVTDTGTEQIAGLLFYLVGAEPAGFNIDNVRFGKAGQVVVQTPEPANLALLGLGLAGLLVARRRKAA